MLFEEISDYLYPARGRKLAPLTCCCSPINISDYLYPARGRKRVCWCSQPRNRNADFRLPLPRKGTETLPHDRAIRNTKKISDYLYPARGRKQLEYHGNRYGYPNQNFRLPLPRKGTETPYCTDKTKRGAEISDYLYPARGRKQLPSVAKFEIG